MALIPMPGRPGPTILDSWAWDAINVANQFYWLSENCRDQWLVGPLLADGFLAISNLFSAIAGYCWVLDAAIRDKWAWVIGLTEGSTFRDILDYFSYHYRSIRDDPVGWVKWRIAYIDNERYDFMFNVWSWFRRRFLEQVWWSTDFLEYPWNWVRDRLGDYRSWTRTFLDNPESIVRTWMFNNVPALYDIYVNPVAWILDKITSWYGWFREFLDSPDNFILDKIKNISYSVRKLLENPGDFIRERLAAICGLSLGDTYSFAISLFREILDRILVNKLVFEQRLKDIVTEIFLWYI